MYSNSNLIIGTQDLWMGEGGGEGGRGWEKRGVSKNISVSKYIMIAFQTLNFLWREVSMQQNWKNGSY